MLEEGVVLEYEADTTLAHRPVRHVLFPEQDLTVIRELEPGDHAQQGRLARPGGSEQCDQFARGDVEIDAGERRKVAEMLVQLANMDIHQCLLVADSASLWRHSSQVFTPKVTSARPASKDATANAAANWYSL